LAALGFDETAQSNGEYPRRWLTAGGKFVGTSAELGLQLTSGGAFNTSNPLPTTEQIGSMEIEFSDCSSGKIITRGLPDTAASSLVIEEVAIKRDFEDSLALCQSQYEGPGQPGPL
jgi:hypothetical protein